MYDNIGRLLNCCNGAFVVATCVQQALASGATPESVMQVVRQAAQMAELPVKCYELAARKGIEAFEAHDMGRSTVRVELIDACFDLRIEASTKIVAKLCDMERQCRYVSSQLLGLC